MSEQREERGGEEVRSPLQVAIRVLLALLVVALLAGLIFAIFLRPDEVVDTPEEANDPGRIHYHYSAAGEEIALAGRVQAGTAAGRSVQGKGSKASRV